MKYTVVNILLRAKHSNTPPKRAAVFHAPASCAPFQPRHFVARFPLPFFAAPLESAAFQPASVPNGPSLHHQCASCQFIHTRRCSAIQQHLIHSLFNFFTASLHCTSSYLDFAYSPAITTKITRKPYCCKNPQKCRTPRSSDVSCDPIGLSMVCKLPQLNEINPKSSPRSGEIPRNFFFSPN